MDFALDNSLVIAYVFEKSNAKSLDSKGQIAFANSVRDIAPSYLKIFMAALTLRVSILFFSLQVYLSTGDTHLLAH